MIGCDIRDMDEATKNILLNEEVIAINQDAAYRQPFNCGNHWWAQDVKVWARFLEGGDIAVGVFNLSDNGADPFFSFDTLGINRSSGKALEVRDIINHETLGVYKDVFRTEYIQPHTCKMYRCTVVDAK